MPKSDDSDTDLFRDTVGTVKPFSTDRSDSQVPKPKPVARFTRADDEAVLDESLGGGPSARALGTGDELEYLKTGLPRSVIRKLKRGVYAIEAEIDLHGLTVIEAKDALDEFFVECHARGCRCVRVVHGKGKGSGHRGPVIKGKVNLWLRRRADILGFVSARPVDGGTGALSVLLSRG